MRSFSTVVTALAVASALGQEPLAQAPASLPDRVAFLAAVRASLFTDDELQRHYTYLERREDIRVSKLGKVSVGRVRLFEVYASPEPGHRYRRLLADNGVPLTDAVLHRRDEAYAKYLADLKLSRERETATDRSAREARERADRQKRDALVDDVFRSFDMHLTRRETLGGRPTIVVSLTPRANVTTTSHPGRYFKKFHGTAWVDEMDHQVVRIDLESIDSILVGWGIVGRVHAGSKLVFERRKVNGEVWLPYRSRIEVKGRALLFRRFDAAALTEYSSYRKFVVDTRETFDLPPR